MDKQSFDWELLLSELISNEHEMNNFMESQASIFMTHGRPGTRDHVPTSLRSAGNNTSNSSPNHPVGPEKSTAGQQMRMTTESTVVKERSTVADERSTASKTTSTSYSSIHSPDMAAAKGVASSLDFRSDQFFKMMHQGLSPGKATLFPGSLNPCAHNLQPQPSREATLGLVPRSWSPGPASKAQIDSPGPASKAHISSPQTRTSLRAPRVPVASDGNHNRPAVLPPPPPGGMHGIWRPGGSGISTTPTTRSKSPTLGKLKRLNPTLNPQDALKENKSTPQRKNTLGANLADSNTRHNPMPSPGVRSQSQLGIMDNGSISHAFHPLAPFSSSPRHSVDLRGHQQTLRSTSGIHAQLNREPFSIAEESFRIVDGKKLLEDEHIHQSLFFSPQAYKDFAVQAPPPLTASFQLASVLPAVVGAAASPSLGTNTVNNHDVRGSQMLQPTSALGEDFPDSKGLASSLGTGKSNSLKVAQSVIEQSAGQLAMPQTEGGMTVIDAPQNNTSSRDHLKGSGTQQGKVLSSFQVTSLRLQAEAGRVKAPLSQRAFTSHETTCLEQPVMPNASHQNAHIEGHATGPSSNSKNDRLEATSVQLRQGGGTDLHLGGGSSVNTESFSQQALSNQLQASNKVSSPGEIQSDLLLQVVEKLRALGPQRLRTLRGYVDGYIDGRCSAESSASGAVRAALVKETLSYLLDDRSPSGSTSDLISFLPKLSTRDISVPALLYNPHSTTTARSISNDQQSTGFLHQLVHLGEAQILDQGESQNMTALLNPGAQPRAGLAVNVPQERKESVNKSEIHTLQEGGSMNEERKHGQLSVSEVSIVASSSTKTAHLIPSPVHADYDHHQDRGVSDQSASRDNGPSAVVIASAAALNEHGGSRAQQSGEALLTSAGGMLTRHKIDALILDEGSGFCADEILPSIMLKAASGRQGSTNDSMQSTSEKARPQVTTLKDLRLQLKQREHGAALQLDDPIILSCIDDVLVETRSIDTNADTMSQEDEGAEAGERAPRNIIHPHAHQLDEESETITLLDPSTPHSTHEHHDTTPSIFSCKETSGNTEGYKQEQHEEVAKMMVSEGGQQQQDRLHNDACSTVYVPGMVSINSNEGVMIGKWVSSTVSQDYGIPSASLHADADLLKEESPLQSLEISQSDLPHTAYQTLDPKERSAITSAGSLAAAGPASEATAVEAAGTELRNQGFHSLSPPDVPGNEVSSFNKLEEGGTLPMRNSSLLEEDEPGSRSSQGSLSSLSDLVMRTLTTTGSSTNSAGSGVGHNEPLLLQSGQQAAVVAAAESVKAVELGDLPPVRIDLAGLMFQDRSEDIAEDQSSPTIHRRSSLLEVVTNVIFGSREVDSVTQEASFPSNNDVLDIREPVSLATQEDIMAHNNQHEQLKMEGCTSVGLQTEVRNNTTTDIQQQRYPDIARVSLDSIVVASGQGLRVKTSFQSAGQVKELSVRRDLEAFSFPPSPSGPIPTAPSPSGPIPTAPSPSGPIPTAEHHNQTLSIPNTQQDLSVPSNQHVLTNPPQWAQPVLHRQGDVVSDSDAGADVRSSVRGNTHLRTQEEAVDLSTQEAEETGVLGVAMASQSARHVSARMEPAEVGTSTSLSTLLRGQQLSSDPYAFSAASPHSAPELAFFYASHATAPSTSAIPQQSVDSPSRFLLHSAEPSASVQKPSGRTFSNNPVEGISRPFESFMINDDDAVSPSIIISGSHGGPSASPPSSSSLTAPIVVSQLEAPSQPIMFATSGTEALIIKHADDTCSKVHPAVSSAEEGHHVDRNSKQTITSASDIVAAAAALREKALAVFSQDTNQISTEVQPQTEHEQQQQQQQCLTALKVDHLLSDSGECSLKDQPSGLVNVTNDLVRNHVAQQSGKKREQQQQQQQDLVLPDMHGVSGVTMQEGVTFAQAPAQLGLQNVLQAPVIATFGEAAIKEQDEAHIIPSSSAEGQHQPEVPVTPPAMVLDKQAKQHQAPMSEPALDTQGVIETPQEHLLGLVADASPPHVATTAATAAASKREAMRTIEPILAEVRTLKASLKSKMTADGGTEAVGGQNMELTRLAALLGELQAYRQLLVSEHGSQYSVAKQLGHLHEDLARWLRVVEEQMSKQRTKLTSAAVAAGSKQSLEVLEGKATLVHDSQSKQGGAASTSLPLVSASEPLRTSTDQQLASVASTAPPHGRDSAASAVMMERPSSSDSVAIVGSQVPALNPTLNPPGISSNHQRTSQEEPLSTGPSPSTSSFTKSVAAGVRSHVALQQQQQQQSLQSTLSREATSGTTTTPTVPGPSSVATIPLPGQRHQLQGPGSPHVLLGSGAKADAQQGSPLQPAADSSSSLVPPIAMAPGMSLLDLANQMNQRTLQQVQPSSNNPVDAQLNQTRAQYPTNVVSSGVSSSTMGPLMVGTVGTSPQESSVRNSFTVLTSLVVGGGGSVSGTSTAALPAPAGSQSTLTTSTVRPISAAAQGDKKDKKKKSGWAKLKAMF
ncbi:hypothetical protein CEUSTIGMA_g12226.t1 [Chlamydomonas eustigma]|uniref:Uncharacterized protein n=1 Tax=Chlamydomonas eustigma TaxID=1157962 RepID=A0A250XNZ6_9CHLO|nr:hypothetical protein CEUSTIGMA_g12226.t1 [Chlamydomonas eustigma]|eukprot:GAX84805.1 hypothetical protein CEUSTIGMA_g12226.t1 [Chlamydomonas eustigma]